MRKVQTTLSSKLYAIQLLSLWISIIQLNARETNGLDILKTLQITILIYIQYVYEKNQINVLILMFLHMKTANNYTSKTI